MAAIAANGRKFEVWTDQIEITSNMPRRNPNWTATDSNGHQHDASGTTFHWVVTETYWYEGDEMEDGEYRCNLCDETVRPGLIGPSPFREFIPGMRHFAIDGVEVTHEEFQLAYEAAGL